MRKIFGGVTVHPDQTAEWYTVSIKNEDGTIQEIYDERFDRKKSYGIDFVIETADRELSQKLTEEEITWFRNADTEELQTLILAARDV
jgi:hypothetical protein